MSTMTEMQEQALGEIRQLSREEIQKVRHKAELPLFAVAAIITVTGYILVAIIGAVSIASEITAMGESLAAATPAEEAMIIEEYAEAISTHFMTAIFVVVLFISLVFMLYKKHAKTRAYSVKVSEKNFPEIHKKNVEFAKMLGLKKVPDVYIQQENGALNAFAAAIFGRRFSQLNAEIVDVAYTETKDFAPVYFILAHEIAHIYLRHVPISFNMLTLIGRIIPIIGPAFSRAREYSSDRLAQLLTGIDGAEEFMLIVAGRRLYRYADLDDYLTNAQTEKGFFLWYVNLMASHPIPLKRITALADPEKKSGKLF